MGMFDKWSPTKILDKITPDDLTKIKEKQQYDVNKAVDKLGTEGTSKGPWYKSGSQAFNTLTMGSMKKDNLRDLTNFGFNPTPSGLDKTVRGQIQSHNQAARRANVGHQAIKAYEGDYKSPDAPGVDPLPPMGAGTTSAKAAARRRAIEMAKGRFGMKGTVTTTPLGLTGEGAPLGKKTLIGT